MREIDPMQYLALLVRLDFPPVDGVIEEQGLPSRRRVEYLFDAISLRSASRDEGIYDVEPQERPIIRIKTTRGKIQKPGGSPIAGDWFLIELKNRHVGAWAWTATETATYPPYSEAGRFSAVRIEFLDPSFDVDASRDPRIGTAFKKLRALSEKRSDLSRSKRGFEKLRSAMGAASDLWVECADVGQASFAYIRDQTSAYIYFDVGLPIWFNRRSLPAPVKYCPPHNDAVVIISHWDFDHYSAFYADQALGALPCIAPQEGKGPNALVMAHRLGGNLTELVWGQRLRVPYVELGWASGGNRNTRGIVGVAKLKGGRVLLTGDAEYSVIADRYKKRLSGVTVPHHASQHSAGSPPTPTASSRAIASAGYPNVYGHPSRTILQSHVSAGWNVEVTGDSSINTRGNKRF